MKSSERYNQNQSVMVGKTKILINTYVYLQLYKHICKVNFLQGGTTLPHSHMPSHTCGQLILSDMKDV